MKNDEYKILSTSIVLEISACYRMPYTKMFHKNVINLLIGTLVYHRVYK